MLKKLKLKRLIESQKMIKLMTELGVFLGLFIIVNFTVNYLTKAIFAEGTALDFGFILVIIVGIRHGAISAGLFKFVGTWILAIIGGVGTIFPPTNTEVFFPILITLLFDFTISTFVAVYVAIFLAKKISNLKLKIILITIIYGVIAFLSGFTSGFLVWGAYTKPGWGVYFYSFIQNLSNYLPTVIFTVIIGLTLVITIPEKFTWQHPNIKHSLFI